MVSWLKRFAAPVAAVALFAAAPAAVRADSVTYHTVATFTSGGGATLNPGDTSITKNGDTLTITDVVSTRKFNADGTPKGAVFADFAVSSLNVLNDQSFNGAGFQIQIFQDATVPGGVNPVGPGKFVGAAKGTLTVDPADSSVLLTFNAPLSFTLPTGATSFPPGVVYTVDGPTQTIMFDLAGLGAVRGNVAEVASAVPLPSTAWMGLGLLGCVGSAGAFKSIRRRRDVLSA